MAIFGGRSTRKRAAKNAADWGNLNRNLVSWEPEEPAKNPKPRAARTNNSTNNTEKIIRKTAEPANQKTKTQLPTDAEPADFVFRRNQTLSTKQRETREKLQRTRERELRARRRRVGILLLSLLTICALGFALLTQFSGGSIAISSSNTTLTSADETSYVKIAEQYLAKNPFERFSFARQKNNFSSFMSSKSPEIASAELSPNGIGGGQLKLMFRRPVASWTVGAGTSFVDADGVVFSRNFFVAPGISISDESGVKDVAASTDFLSFVGQVSSNLASAGSVVTKVVIPRGAIRYVNFYLSGRAYPFMAQIDRDAASQAADIASSIKYLDQNHISPQYVDVRIAGKMYWK